MNTDVTVHNLDELIKQVFFGISGQRFCHVWRGQADESWPPYPGLIRRLLSEYDESCIDERLISRYEQDLLKEAIDLGFYGEHGGNRLSFMVDLQHAGGATRLLDVTWDPFVAIWFAVISQDNADGAVYQYSVSSDCHLQRERVDGWSSITEGKKAGKAILYTPRPINERIKAQSAAFLTGSIKTSIAEGSLFTEETSSCHIRKIIIPSDLKPTVIEYLKKSRGMRSYDLFPDFEGFAHANSYNSPFPRAYEDLFSLE